MGKPQSEAIQPPNKDTVGVKLRPPLAQELLELLMLATQAADQRPADGETTHWSQDWGDSQDLRDYKKCARWPKVLIQVFHSKLAVDKNPESSTSAETLKGHQ